MASLASATHHLRELYWPLIKSRQTFLLTLTGIAGYLCQPPSPLDWLRFLSMAGSLLVTISGSSVLNMLFDRDLDRKMSRTRQRPLAAGALDTRAAAFLGVALVALGLFWSSLLSFIYLAVILAGAALNVLVYTLWLKRRTAWSILWGGLAGSMPVLAGRTLATGKIDALGLLLGFAILCWIPSHNLTLSILYSTDYLDAGVPTFLNGYGLGVTRRIVTLSSLLTALVLIAAFTLLESSFILLAFIAIASLALLAITLFAWWAPSQKVITVLYKYSSLYMLFCMVLLGLNWI